jgi:hypothetical protein
MVRRGVGGRHLRFILHVYEQMGTIIATWYSNARILNKAGNPLLLSAGRGPFTIQSLVQASGAKIPCAVVMDLMQLSLTITIVQRDNFLAVSRFFSLKVARLLRDIKVPGSAFMDSVDGQIEANKSRNASKTNPGELGVFMFAWMGSSRGSRRGT